MEKMIVLLVKFLILYVTFYFINLVIYYLKYIVINNLNVVSIQWGRQNLN